MQLQPYLFFNGRCEEAIQFYQRAVGAQVLMQMRYQDSPQPHAPGMVPAGWDAKIMHASLKIGESTVSVSDGSGCETTGFHGFALTLNTADAAEADRTFASLLDGGEVRMPLATTFFSSRFGMLVDRFGVLWMVIVSK